MPTYPSNVSLVTVTGYWSLSDGSGPASGIVTFLPTCVLQDGTSTPQNIVLPKPVTAILSGGAISVQLMATDDTHLSPTGWYWTVVENIAGQASTRTYNIQLPKAVTPVDLSTIAPLATPPALVAYVAASAVGAPSGVASLGPDGILTAAQRPTPYTVFTFSQAGTVTATNGTARIYNDTGHPLTIQAVRASVGTAPTGGSLIVDVRQNGASIFTNQANRPSIPAGSNTSGKVTPDVTAFAAGDYFTVDVAQVGSSVPGSDLTVQIWAA